MIGHTVHKTIQNVFLTLGKVHFFKKFIGFRIILCFVNFIREIVFHVHDRIGCLALLEDEGVAVDLFVDKLETSAFTVGQNTLQPNVNGWLKV